MTSRLYSVSNIRCNVVKATQVVRKEKEKKTCIAPTSKKYMLTYFDCFPRTGAYFVKLIRNIWFKAVSETFILFLLTASNALLLGLESTPCKQEP